MYAAILVETPEDLAKVESSAHPHTIYYALGTKQKIGVLSMVQLDSRREE